MDLFGWTRTRQKKLEVLLALGCLRLSFQDVKSLLSHTVYLSTSTVEMEEGGGLAGNHRNRQPCPDPRPSSTDIVSLFSFLSSLTWKADCTSLGAAFQSNLGNGKYKQPKLVSKAWLSTGFQKATTWTQNMKSHFAARLEEGQRVTQLQAWARWKSRHRLVREVFLLLIWAARSGSSLRPTLKALKCGSLGRISDWEDCLLNR